MPPERKLLKTFVHISDLHVGDIDPRYGDAKVSPQAGYVYQNCPWLDGLLGHHGRALQELEDFCATLTDNHEPFELLISGDLTRCGSASEIATVQSFITSRIDLQPPRGNLTGLNLGTMPPASITGNHDQWGGRNHPIGGGPLASGALVPQSLPFVSTYPLANGRRLILAGIDTDSNVHPWGLMRFFAMGSFQDQLMRLAPGLPRYEPRDIRVFLAHHSLAKAGVVLRMDDASKDALSIFLADHRFSIVLSGHTHRRLFTTLTVTRPQGTFTVEELTCGSTTQHDQVPYNWRSVLGNLPARGWRSNTLMVHRLLAIPGKTLWETQAYVRTPQGFKSVGVSGEFAIPV
jgi:hypothetical protein